METSSSTTIICNYLTDGIAKIMTKGIAAQNALYGFYARKFKRYGTLDELPRALALALVGCELGTTRKEFLELAEELDPNALDELHVRVCDNCGKFIHEGYYLGGEYACDENCAIPLYKGMTPKAAKRQFERDLKEDEKNDAGECYWTEW
jgi:hypothetical protein